jgi:exonuclease SbcC
MENFRRHASTELRFDEGGQIVLIAGPNGAGKSSIIEAIVFALYGEGRNGNRWLDRLVRRGGELEGMEVEIEFDVDGISYRIKRRRDNKMGSAVIWGNDVSLTEGSREVTMEVTRVLGMDARGFRLAVVAQQKELDGLASMRPAERGSMLSRLLRLDALTSAKDVARGRFRAEREALRGLGSVEGLDDLDRELDELTLSIEAGAAAELDTATALGTLDAELAAGAGIEAAYLAASTNVARVSGLLASAKSERDRIAGELGRIEIVEVDVSDIDLEELTARSGELVQAIASGEAAKTMASQASSVRRELEETTRRLAEITIELEGAELDEAAALTLVAQAQEAITKAQEELTRVGEERARILALAGEAEAAIDRAKSLGATCEECGQEVSDEHRHTQQERAEWRQQELLGHLAKSNLDTAKTSLSQAEAELSRCREGLEGVRKAKRSEVERSDLIRRSDTYQSQLDRLDVPAVDLESLFAERGRLEADLVLARNLLDQKKMSDMMKERKKSVEENWRAAMVRCEEAESLAEQSRIDTDLEAAHARLSAMGEARQSEYEVLAGLREDLARKRERHAGAIRERERVAAAEVRRRGMEHAGVVASLTAEVLERVATNLNQQIRPQLEGGISEILSRMSDGRFDAVHLDEDYTLSVRDDGQLRSLSEFSGGEIDLIALSVRLALAEVVSERHGAGGAGFLILDECFGSQDQDRRGSIMTALRGLRGTYGQILLISHVGGLEDAADVVVEVGIDEASGLAVAVMEN